MTCEYKPLPNSVTDFIAESMCGILEAQQQPRRCNWDFVPLPELLLFVRKVTTKAKINIQTAIAALILVSRLKDRLPRNAHGEYGTYHKIFLSALLVASKVYMTQENDEHDDEHDDDDGHFSDSVPPSCCSTAITLPEEIDASSEFILSSTPSSIISIEDHDQDSARHVCCNYKHHRRNSIINKKLAEVSGVYTLQEVNQMERDFTRLLGNQNSWVSEQELRDFVENNRYALGICYN